MPLPGVVMAIRVEWGGAASLSERSRRTVTLRETSAVGTKVWLVRVAVHRPGKNGPDMNAALCGREHFLSMPFPIGCALLVRPL